MHALGYVSLLAILHQLVVRRLAALVARVSIALLATSTLAHPQSHISFGDPKCFVLDTLLSRADLNSVQSDELSTAKQTLPEAFNYLESLFVPLQAIAGLLGVKLNERRATSYIILSKKPCASPQCVGHLLIASQGAPLLLSFVYSKYVIYVPPSDDGQASFHGLVFPFQDFSRFSLISHIGPTYARNTPNRDGGAVMAGEAPLLNSSRILDRFKDMRLECEAIKQN